MSRRFWPVLALGLFATAAPVRAQMPEEESVQERMTRLWSHIDSLAPLVEEAKAARDARNARVEDVRRIVAAESAAVDTLAIGLLTVITPVGQVEVARDIFSEVWTEHFADIDRSPAASDARFVFQWSDELHPIYVEPGRYRAGIEQSETVDRDKIVQMVRDAISTVLYYDLTNPYTVDGVPQPRSLPMWTGNNPLADRDWADTYRSAALTRSIAARDCLAGDAAACASAMGLDVEIAEGDPGVWLAPVFGPERGLPRVGADRIATWYSPAERRERVRALGATAWKIDDRQWESCLQDADQAMCDSVLRLAGGLAIPFDGEVRSSLVAYALERGGYGAWSRLTLDPTHTPTEALEYASGVAVDDLVDGWMERVLEARPVSYGSLVPHGALTLLWIAFFGALAARSTRWRLG